MPELVSPSILNIQTLIEGLHCPEQEFGHPERVDREGEERAPHMAHASQTSQKAFAVSSPAPHGEGVPSADAKCEISDAFSLSSIALISRAHSGKPLGNDIKEGDLHIQGGACVQNKAFAHGEPGR